MNILDFIPPGTTNTFLSPKDYYALPSENMVKIDALGEAVIIGSSVPWPMMSDFIAPGEIVCDCGTLPNSWTDRDSFVEKLAAMPRIKVPAEAFSAVITANHPLGHQSSVISDRVRECIRNLQAVADFCDGDIDAMKAVRDQPSSYAICAFAIMAGVWGSIATTIKSQLGLNWRDIVREQLKNPDQALNQALKRINASMTELSVASQSEESSRQLILTKFVETGRFPAGITNEMAAIIGITPEAIAAERLRALAAKGNHVAAAKLITG